MAEFKCKFKFKSKFYASLELFSKIVDCPSTRMEGQRRPCGFGPHSGEAALDRRWFRRALRKRGLSESVSVSPGRNRLGPPKRCNWVGPFLRNKGISTLEKDLKSSEIIAQIVSCRACRRRRRRPSADERMQKSMDCVRITSSAAPLT